jgi:ATP-dependent DNA ligase
MRHDSQTAGGSCLFDMPQRLFEPCIPTRATKVPAGREWIHEIKHDGYRLIVQREGKRVRLGRACRLTVDRRVG